ncbi:MAG: RagB/SusD family nutrient uptake outer membrane protein [Tannerellaceae bacterium]|jgi:hypothetical protein|nr:RagB/SusD family nutrient uptake outer membrane protein [Tannerellaceae bacterium]
MKYNHIQQMIKAAAFCAIIGTGSFFASCEDMLETKNFMDMSPGNFFQTEGDMEAATTGLYKPCTTDWGYDDGGWKQALFNADYSAYNPAGMLSTDIVRSYNGNHDYDIFNVGPSTGGPIESTYNIIRFVARGTDVINRIEQSSGATEDIRRRFIAETKTLRAFYMFTLLDWFGPVNVKLDPETLMSNVIEPRPSLADYVGYIEKDLDDAINTPSFPDKYNDNASQWGRMSKSIAYALRMKLYMHQKDWSKAKAAASQLMTMGYSLLPDYNDVFNLKQQAEHIWSIPANEASDNFFMPEVIPGDFRRGYNHLDEPYMRGDSDWGGWQEYCMRWDFYDTFQDNDVRKRGILGKYENNAGVMKDRTNGMVGAIPIKFTDTQTLLSNPFGIQKDQPVIRYAEVLLSYAEAENELNGPTPGAVAALKQVTDRAQVEIPASATASKDTFRSYLLQERGHELYCEGQRRQDLIRHGEYITRAYARGCNAKEHQTLYPIPQNVITEAGGILEQNAGYTN